jgi:H+/Cl- antiporter ClcA
LFWASEGEIIKGLTSSVINVETQEIVVFFVCWYGLTCITYGTFVPAGLFLPGMILGCCIGNFFGELCIVWEILPVGSGPGAIKNFVVIGTASVLAGYTRLTYSLAIIMMETAQVMNLFIPIFFTVLISNWVGKIFTRGLYDRAVRGKQMPVLQDWIPLPCQGIIAEQMMSKEVVTLNRVDNLGNVLKAMN